MKLEDIKTPEDILEFLRSNIEYGWIDINGEEHFGTMKDFRKLYRTSSIEETLHSGLGTCIEQVNLMHILLDTLGIPNKMFCTRIYEKDKNPDEDINMHCFILYYQNGKVYQIEHPNLERAGIYEFQSTEEAISKINSIYVEMSHGIPRPATEYTSVEPGLSFEEFNSYINSLDNSFHK